LANRIPTLFIAVVATFVFVVLPSGANAQKVSFIRDSEIEATIRAYATPLYQAANLDPSAVRVYLVNDQQINAFVAGGQRLFLNTGLLMQTDSAGQVIGVIAHEVGHIEGGHLARVHDALRRGTAESIIGVILGAAAAVAGRPDIGGAIIAGGQNVALRNLLQYSRTQEGAADAAAMRYLDATQQSARGLLEFFGKLSGQELLTPTRQDPYLRTHPLTQDRIVALNDFVSRSPYSDVAIKPEFQDSHRRLKAKLHGFLEDPELTFRRYPESDGSLYGRYARAIALHKMVRTEEAVALIDGLIAEVPNDPYFHELKGQVLFERGRPADALGPYEQAVLLAPEAPLMRVDLARVQMALGRDELRSGAIRNFRMALAREPDRPFVWRQLAIALGQDGQMGESALALAEEALLLGKKPEARFQANKAKALLPPGSPSALRADDILQTTEKTDE
jgi:predicted Zn-dependent protease